MKTFEQAKKERLIKEAHALLDRAEFLVARMVTNAKSAQLKKAA